MNTQNSAPSSPVSERLQERIRQRLAQDPDVASEKLFAWVRDKEPLLDQASIAGAVELAIGRARGLGPLAPLLEEPGLSEIMINGPGHVWTDGSNGLRETDLRFDTSDIALLIERILDPLGLRVDRVSPLVDARLSDGSRVNIVVPPLAVDGPIVTIRRFSTKPVPLAAFVDPSGEAILRALVEQRQSVLVVGGTGAGKTTLLNAMGHHLEQRARVIVIEDTAELQLPGQHIIRLEARPANSEGVGAVTLRQLVRNALRMRPDRIVVGEVRGGEALDLLLALNTGHRGSLMTCHANSAAAGLQRLETLCLMGGLELPLTAIRQQILSGLDAVVHVCRSEDGERQVREIARVQRCVATGAPLAETMWSGS